VTYSQNSMSRDTELHDPFTSDPAVRRAAVRQLLGNHALDACDARFLLGALGLTAQEGELA
jgi:hypothetical protein